MNEEVHLRKISKRYRKTVAAVAVAALGVGVFAGLAPLSGGASSHREAPLTAQEPQIDNTDVYAFVSPDRPDTVTLISNWIPFEEPAGGPNFYFFNPQTEYDIKIDNDGDAKADIVYEWLFDNHVRNNKTFLYNTGPVTSLRDPNLNFYQTYDLVRVDYRNKGGFTRKQLVNDALVVPSFVGDASMPNYGRLFRQGITSFGGGRGRTWAGQADDPFFLDLRLFDLLYGGDFSEIGDDTLKGFNVNSMAIQVPKNDLAMGRKAGKNPVIGVWSAANRRSIRIQTKEGKQKYRGEFVQVSRLGNPLVNEVVIPRRDKDRFNASLPVHDAQFLKYVTNPEVPRLVEAIYGIEAPRTPRKDLVQVFLTGVPGLNKPKNVRPSEQLRLNMSIPPCEEGECPDFSRLGVIGGDLSGYPNGRRLPDDVLDISLQVLEGELIGNPNDLGDAVDTNDKPFMDTFPFLAMPYSGSNPNPHGGQQA